MLGEIEKDIAKASTKAMKRVSTELKEDLRGQVTRAGFSRRLANTWRSEVYPKQRNSMNAAGTVWSVAPAIIDSYARGVTIRPTGGKRFLWIPTKNVPRRAGRRGRSRSMDPHEVETLFNQDLIIRNGKGGNKLAFVLATGARSGRGVRPLTPGRAKQGRTTKLTLMFVLVRSTSRPKLFDLTAAAERGADAYTRYLGEELAR